MRLEWLCIGILKVLNILFTALPDNPALNLLHQSFVGLVEAQDIAVLTLNESEPVQHKSTGYNLHFVPSRYGGKKMPFFMVYVYSMYYFLYSLPSYLSLSLSFSAARSWQWPPICL